MTAILGLDYTTWAAIAAFVLSSLKGYALYRQIQNAVPADVHAFRIAVDDIDNAVQAGTIPSETAAKQIFYDLETLVATVKASAKPAPAPAQTPTA
jgi:hypothetical protein